MPVDKRTRVLGIDPGSLKAGWGVIDVEEGARRVHHVDNGVLFLEQDAPLPERILRLSRGLHEVIETFRPHIAAVEEVFVNRGARSALILGQARGAVLATVGLCGVPVASHASSRVKMRVTGSGRASKEQVQEMVMRLLGLTAHPFEDAADALAVALCHGFEGFAEATLARATPAPGAARPVRGHKGKRAGLAALARAQGKL
jgi:crossover junction endodeoxyribonuclease RuvC